MTTIDDTGDCVWPASLSDASCNEGWLPLEECQASRLIESRSQASARVFTSYAGRKVILESYLEQKILLLLRSRLDVVSIEEQPSAVSFVDNAGRRRQHFFDFRIEMAHGTRIAVDVKPLAKITSQFREDLISIARQVDPSFAEGVIVLTDESASQVAVADAMIINSVKKDTDFEAYAKLTELTHGLSRPVTVRDLGAQLNRRTSGFRAVVRLIADGLLVRITDAPLCLDTLVCAASPGARMRSIP